MRLEIFLIFCVIFGVCRSENNGMGDQIRMILKHYQQDNPVGLPGDLVDDPKDIPDFKQNILMNVLQFTEVKAFGLSKFRITNVSVELATMQAFITVIIDNLQVRGFYEQRCVWFCTGGKNKFTVEFLNITISGSGKLKVGINGKLWTENLDVDLAIGTIHKKFENLDGLGSFVDSAMDGNFIFGIIKPMIRKEVNTNLRNEVNGKLSKLPNPFPNSIAPIDVAVLGVRRQIREMELDPLRMEDYSKDFGFLSVASTDAFVVGLSNVYRSDNITLEMRNNTVSALLNFATERIEGETHWKIEGICGLLSKSGGITFSIEYLRANARITQSLDTRKKLSLEELHFELGNIETRVNGITGTMDYILEAATNIFPNLLRYQVLEAMEKPMRKRIKTEFDRINVQKMIEDNIPGIEEQAKRLEDIFRDNEEDVLQ